MSRKLRLQRYPSSGEITIANGANQPIHIGGNYVRVKKATGSFTLKIDDDIDLQGCAKDDIFELDDGQIFGKLEVVNDSGADLTFQLEIGYGKITSNALAINSAVTVKGGDTLAAGETSIDTTADGTAIFAADADRTGWTVANPSDTEDLLIGPVGSCVYPVAPGAEKSGTGTYALYGRYATETNDVPYMTEAKG